MTKRDANSVCLAALVDDAIKNKDTSVIEETEDKNHLKYMQKDVEMRILRKDSIFSILSLDIGIKGIFLCIFAIGLSLFLVGISIDGLSEITYPVCGFFIMLFAGVGVVWWDRKYKKELEKIGKDAEFMCDLILKIEEKLLK